MTGWYNQGKACVNGHAVTGNLGKSASAGDKFCSRCGASTIDACPECRQPLRGEFEVSSVVVLGGLGWTPPTFCHNCGKALPWTAARLAAAKELAEEADGLDEAERTKLQAALDDVVSDNPRTAVAATRIKKALAKLPGAAGKALRDLVVDIASEAAKKLIFGPGA